jgi:hypothetical protein
MEFVSPDPEAQVRAANVRATLDAFQLRPSLGRKLIERHQLALEDLRPENFIPVQRWLDALKEIQEEIGTNLLHRVGIAILENADLPPGLDSIDVVLGAFDDIYYANHRGNVGHYRSTRRPDGVWEVRCETPYPRHFEHGLVVGISRKFAGKKVYHVDYVEAPPGGDLTCTMIVRPG